MRARTAWVRTPYLRPCNETRQVVIEEKAPVDRMAFWTAALFASVLHCIPHFPPQIDLAQHAAQIRLLHDWTQPDFRYREILELNFFTPYLPAYLLGTLLSFAMSPVSAVKLVWSLGAFGTIYASVRIRRMLGGSWLLDWLLLPGLFGVTFVWGFLTFQFAIPFGLLAIEGWLRYLQNPGRRRGIFFGALLVALFFCHVLVTGWVVGVCGTMLLARARTSQLSVRTFLMQGLPLLAPIPIMALWIFVTSSAPQARSGLVWDVNASRVLDFFPQWIGLAERTMAASLGLPLLVLPFVAGARFSADADRRVPLGITMLILFLAPNFMFGNSFTYNRFFTLLGPSLLIAFSGGAPPTRRPFLARVGVPTLAVLVIALLSIRMVNFSEEQQDFRRLITAMDPDRSAISVIEQKESAALEAGPSYLHFPTWYQAEKGGLVEFSIASFYPMIVRYRSTYRPAIDERFNETPVLDWSLHRVQDFDYVVVRAADSKAAPLAGYPLRLERHEGTWWLYATAGVKSP